MRVFWSHSVQGVVHYARDLPLAEWLMSYTFPLEARCEDLTYAQSVWGHEAAEVEGQRRGYIRELHGELFSTTFFKRHTKSGETRLKRSQSSLFSS